MSRPKLTAPVRRGARLFQETGPDFDVVCRRLQRGGWSGAQRRDFHTFQRWLDGMIGYAAAGAAPAEATLLVEDSPQVEG